MDAIPEMELSRDQLLALLRQRDEEVARLQQELAKLQQQLDRLGAVAPFGGFTRFLCNSILC